MSANPDNINYICQQCYSFIQSGYAQDNQWLQTKKDILNQWMADRYLSPGQVDIIIKMYNIEVIGSTIPDTFSSSTLYPKKQKSTPRKPPPIDDDIPF